MARLRLMHDAVNVLAIPSTAGMVAGYEDGRWQTVAALRARFPHAQVVTITVNGTTAGAHVIDCEKGDASPATAALWAAAELHAGRRPTIYTFAANWPAVEAAVKKAGIDGRVSYWIADWTGKPHIPPGAVACQFDSPDRPGSRVRYDLSAVAAHWPGVDPEPAPGKPRGLSRPALLLVRRLTKALGRYHRGVTQNRADLEALGREVTRVLGLKP